MKEVIIKDSQYVSSTDMSLDKYYGIQLDTEKALVVRDGWNSGHFRVRCINLITKGNEYGSYASSSLNGVAKKCQERGIDMFEFDTYEELLTWLVEGEGATR